MESIFNHLDGELVDIVDWACEHHKKSGVPSKLAVNVSSWWYKNLSKLQVQEVRTRSGKETNPAETNVLIYCLRILHLGIQLVLVFDGQPTRLHNGGRPHPGYDPPTPLLRETFTKLGILWSNSPGEADAECARLEELGVVDAVWSDSEDALAYGCKTLIRSYYEIRLSTEKDKETKSHVSFLRYTTEATSAKCRGMDGHGFVLNALLSGGEKGSLPDFMPRDALRAARNGLGKSLHAASDSKVEFQKWKESKLATYLKDIHRDHELPEDFPTYAQLEDYTKPRRSQDDTLQKINFTEMISDKHEEMFQFMATNYQWSLKKFVKWLIPYFLVKSLLATEVGNEHQHDLLDFTCNLLKKKKPKKAEAEFVLAAATSLDLSSLKQERFTLETLVWILRRARLNNNLPVTSFFTTPQSARTSTVGIGARSAPAGTRPQPFHITVGGSTQVPSSRAARQRTPPSPTPVRRPRPGPVSSQAGARTTRPVAPMASAEASNSAGKGKGRADDVPLPEASTSKRNRSPTPEGDASPSKKAKSYVIDLTHSFASTNSATLPLLTARPSQEDYGSPPSSQDLQELPLLTAQPYQEDYGSPPSSQDLQALPIFSEAAQEVIVLDDSETEGGYGSFPSSPDLEAVL